MPDKIFVKKKEEQNVCWRTFRKPAKTGQQTEHQTDVFLALRKHTKTPEAVFCIIRSQDKWLKEFSGHSGLKRTCWITSFAPNINFFNRSVSWGDWKRKYRKREYRGMEYASTEYVSTNMQGWKMQVRKTQVRVCNGGKRKYSNLKSILKSLRFSSLAFSVDPLSIGLDQFTCTVPDRCYTQEIGLMLDSYAEGPGFKNRRQDAVE